MKWCLGGFESPPGNHVGGRARVPLAKGGPVVVIERSSSSLSRFPTRLARNPCTGLAVPVLSDINPCNPRVETSRRACSALHRRRVRRSGPKDRTRTPLARCCAARAVARTGRFGETAQRTPDKTGEVEGARLRPANQSFSGAFSASCAPTRGRRGATQHSAREGGGGSVPSPPSRWSPWNVCPPSLLPNPARAAAPTRMLVSTTSTAYKPP